MGVVSYLSARDEINEVFDANFKQIALLLDRQKNVMVDAGAGISNKKKLKGEEDFLIQFWSPDLKLSYSTHPLIPFVAPDKQGFQTRNFNGEEWRSYATSRNGMTVQVSQPQSARDAMIVEITLKMLLPVLLQFPILGLLTWLAVKRSLGALVLISGSLQKRSATSLQPLPSESIPEEITPLVMALNDLLSRLEEAAKLQRQFTADAAHELRTPLAAVQLQLQLLSRTKNEDERQEAIENLTQGVHRSIRLVEQLLAFARLESEAQPAARIDALKVCREVVKLLTGPAIQKNIDLGISRQEPAFLFTIPGNMQAVMTNIIENSLLYTPANGQIDVAMYTEDGRAVFEVSDNGPGIPPHERSRIFDRFYRVPGNMVQGTGLGLAIVKSILDKDGADITVTTGINGKGARFKVVYPPSPA